MNPAILVQGLASLFRLLVVALHSDWSSKADLSARVGFVRCQVIHTGNIQKLDLTVGKGHANMGSVFESIVSPHGQTASRRRLGLSVSLPEGINNDKKPDTLQTLDSPQLLGETR